MNHAGMDEVEREAEDDPAPEQRGGDRVEADRGGCDGHRQDDLDQARRHADHVLERPLPALPLNEAAGAEEHRRPDAHHPGAERRVQQPRPRPRPAREHVVRDRREEDRRDRRVQDEEAGHGQVLDVEDPARPEEAERPAHSCSRVACLRPCHSKTRSSTRPPARYVRPIPSSVASRPVTSEKGSPAARSRAAWIACVSGQHVRDVLHPARELGDRDVRAREDEQEPEDDVREHGVLADAKRDRGVGQAEPRARERGDEDHDREARDRSGREGHAEDDAAGGEREGRDEGGVAHHRQRPPDEEREPLGGADEDRAAACSGSAPRSRSATWRTGTGSPRTGSRSRSRRRRPTGGRPSARCTRRAGSGRSARR